MKADTLNRRTFLKFVGLTTAATLAPMPFAIAGPLRNGPLNRTVSGAAVQSVNRSGAVAKAIPTATGEIFPDQMGITSVHEHIVMPGDPTQRAKSFEFAVADLKKAKELGLRTVVDVGPTDDVVGIQEVSKASGVNVICCTGSYLLKDDQQSMTVADFESRMLNDIEKGIQGTQIRPGVIKVAALRLPITPAEKNLFTAAGHVQKRYNLPICTHAVSGCVEQQQILEAAGADLAHCYFSHVEATFGWGGRTVEQEIDYLETVVKKGSTLSFNNFGNWNHTKPNDLARIIQELTKRGYDDRMVATIDLTWTMVDGNIKILWEDTNEDGKDRTYSYPLRKVVPWLKEQGISKASIDKFMVANPRRIFTW